MRQLLFLLIIFFYIPAPAQTPASFFVYRLTGSGYYQRDKYRIALKIGTALAVTDNLVLNKGTTLQILCDKLALFTISSSTATTTVSLAKYGDSCKSSEKSAAHKDLAFIWQRFTTEAADPTTDKNNYLAEYGGVEKGCGDVAYAALPDTLALIKGCSIPYHPADTTESFVLAIFTDAQASYPVYRAAWLNHEFLLPDSMVSTLDTGAVYSYTVTRNGQEDCGRKALTYLSATAVDSLRRRGIRNFGGH